MVDSPIRFDDEPRISFENPLPEEEAARQKRIQTIRETGDDVGKSAVAGVRSGVEGTLGMVGDASKWQRKRVADLLRFLNAPESVVLGAQKYMPTLSTVLNPGRDIGSRISGGDPDMPTTEAIHEKVQPYAPEMTNYEPKTTAGEYAKTGGEFATGIIGPGGPMRWARRGVTDVVAPALGSETMGQMTKGGPLEGPARFLGGLLAGPAAREQVKAGPITPDAQYLRDRGIDLSAGQATNSRTLKTLETELGGGAYEDLVERQRRQFSDQAMRETGAPPGTNARSEEMVDQYERLGQQYGAIEAGAGDVPFDTTYQQQLIDAQRQYRRRTGTGSGPTMVDDTLASVGAILRQNPANPSINGEQLATLRHDLGRDIRAARDSGDVASMETLQAYQDTLNTALETHLQQVNPQQAGQLAETNRQYRNYLEAERAVTGSAAGGEAGAAAGVITPTNLRNAIRSVEGRRALALARGDLTELANAGTTTMMNSPPQSGTAARTMARAAPAAAGAMFFGGAPPSAIGAAAGGIAAPWVAGRALMSQPVQEFLMQAPSRERQALAAILAANQTDKGGGGW